MGAEKIYQDDVVDTTQPIVGELALQGEEFEYEIFFLPIIGASKDTTEKMLIARFGNRIQNGQRCLDIDEALVTENIENDEYSAIVFVKNKNYDDAASGTMQSYDWCEKGTPQIWINDLCRIATQKRGVSPTKALLQVFETIVTKYVKGTRDIRLMVDKHNMEEANVLTTIYSKYGYSIVDQRECGIDEYFIMKKSIGLRGGGRTKRLRRRQKRSKTLRKSRGRRVR
jgi:hypothetical protein